MSDQSSNAFDPQATKVDGRRRRTTAEPVRAGGSAADAGAAGAREQDGERVNPAQYENDGREDIPAQYEY